MNEVVDINDGLFQEEKTLEEYWNIIKRRWHLIVLVILIFVAVAMFREYQKIPLYRASGTLLIERENRNLQMFNTAFSFSEGWRNEYLNTQVRILTSRRLAREVAEELQLMQKNMDQDEDPSSAAKNYITGLTVIPIEDTRLVEVSYTSPNPEFATLAVNTLFKNFIRFNLDLKTESTKLASEFLFKQINELRKTLSQKERELQDYGKRKELFYLSNRDSTVVEKFGDLNKAYTEAQIQRINMEAVYRELKEKNFENYPEVRNNNLIQSFKQKYSALENEYEKKSQVFRESYPEMQRLKAEMQILRERIRQETLDIGRKALKEAEANYQSALKKEGSLSELLNRQKGEVISTKTDAIYYNSLQIEVTNLRNLLDHLVKKQKESLLTSRLEGLQTSNIKVIDPAEVPGAPIGSNKKKVFLLSLFLGLFCGGGLVFLLEWLDKTVRTPEEVEKFLRIPSLGFIPALGTQGNNRYYGYGYGYSDRKSKSNGKEIKKIELANYIAPESSIAEGYRSIRTSILLSTPASPPKIITVSSSLPKEGKTSTVVNLAVSFTKLGKKVLIIDGDLRKPSIHSIFKVKNTSGLSSYLVGKDDFEDIFFKTEVDNLYVIPSGPIPPNPAELLESERMTGLLKKMKEHFDVIFIDSPPLIGIVDPVIVGRHSEGTMLVIWGGKTHKRFIEKAKAELDKYQIRILGTVLNKINMKKSQGYQYYSYRNYKYYYRYEKDKAGKKADNKEGRKKLKGRVKGSEIVGPGYRH